jgi:hypothetical protein
MITIELTFLAFATFIIHHQLRTGAETALRRRDHQASHSLPPLLHCLPNLILIAPLGTRRTWPVVKWLGRRGAVEVNGVGRGDEVESCFAAYTENGKIAVLLQ